jgi:two-component system, LytTR family, response regulator
VRALIVDDEAVARRGVALRLRRHPDIEIVGECGDGPRAIDDITRLAPDLVFLDVQMPGMDGFEVLASLPRETLPAIIFLTAYEQHALRAFEIHALDYLLKPAQEDRLEAALSRARQALAARSHGEISGRILKLLEQEARTYPARFTVRIGNRIEIVPVGEVQWIGAAGDYAELHTRERSYLVRETMSSLAQKLDPRHFLRIHRSRIIRLDSLRELKSRDNGEYLATLRDGSEHRSSRTYAEDLERWLFSGLS